jgi:O-succinylbenzoic acid--CoA ligase
VNTDFNLNIANHSLSAEEIQQLKSSPFPENEYASLVFKFAKGWLSGQQYFEFNTSGSTGAPKTIIHSRTAIIASIESTAAALSLKAGDTALLCLNVEMTGGRMMLYRALHLGLQLTTVSPSGNPFSHTTNHFDFLSFVPLQIQQILEHKEYAERLNLAKAIILGGTYVSDAIIASLQMITSPVYSTYGMTETISHIALQRLNGNEKENYYHTLPGVELSLDERGCLCIKGKVTYDEMITTNDLAILHDAQHFSIHGRADQMINSGGIKINPFTLEASIEEVLKQESIKEYFMAGLPHHSLGQMLVLFVLSENNDNSLLMEELKKILKVSYMLPKKIISVQQFIYNASGKTDRLKIIEQYLETHHA